MNEDTSFYIALIILAVLVVLIIIALITKKKREKLINHVDPCMAKYQGHAEGDCYSINEKKLLV